MWVKHRNWTKDLPNTRGLLNPLSYKWETHRELIYFIYFYFISVVSCFLCFIWLVILLHLISFGIQNFIIINYVGVWDMLL